MHGIRGEVLDFAINHMEPVLQKNDYKGGWQQMTNREIEIRLKQELAELVTEMRRGPIKYSEDRIITEATDIANFCMFVVDNAKRRQRATK